MNLKILILFLCFSINTSSANAKNIILDESKSKITYSLSKFGITFKKKPLPVFGEINLDRENSILLSSLNLTARFTSTNPLFRRVIKFEKYPDFKYSFVSLKPVKLQDKKFIEIIGDLSFHGITKQVKTKLKIRSVNNITSLTGFLNIKMTNFGLEPPRILFIPIDDVIKTKIELYTFLAQ